MADCITTPLPPMNAPSFEGSFLPSKRSFGKFRIPRPPPVSIDRFFEVCIERVMAMDAVRQLLLLAKLSLHAVAKHFDHRLVTQIGQVKADDLARFGPRGIVEL